MIETFFVIIFLILFIRILIAVVPYVLYALLIALMVISMLAILPFKISENHKKEHPVLVYSLRIIIILNYLVWGFAWFIYQKSK